MPIQCPECHRPISETARFCPHCGSSIGVALEKQNGLPVLQANSRSASLHFQSLHSPRKTNWPATCGIRDILLLPIPPLSVLSKFGFGWHFCVNVILLFPFYFPALLHALILLALPRYNYIGIVTHLRESPEYVNLVTHLRETPDSPDWLFQLRRTNKKWQMRRERRGFLQPVIEVVFRSNRLYGDSLEEGSRVVIQGKKQNNIIVAKQIWNLSPGETPLVRGELEIYSGKVTEYHETRVPDSHFPGQNLSLEICYFRLQCQDVYGNLLRPMPVEIRAQSISGTLRNGDTIEVGGHMVNGTLYAREIINKTLGGVPIVIRGWTGAP